jgi:predicted small secreted protein
MEAKMAKPVVAFTCFALLLLSSCANTAYGLKRDGQQASAAMDDASNRVLSEGAQ